MLKNPLMEQLRAKVSAEDKAVMDESFALADRIFFLLKKHNMTQRQLAERLKKRESEVSKWLSGGHNFTQATLTRIGLAIGERVYEIPGKQTKPNTVVEENLHVLHSIISRIFDWNNQMNISSEDYTASKDVSSLEVTAEGVICSKHSEDKNTHFTPANLPPSAFKKIEKALLS